VVAIFVELFPTAWVVPIALDDTTPVTVTAIPALSNGVIVLGAVFHEPATACVDSM
jgi:hypothetical protein